MPKIFQPYNFLLAIAIALLLISFLIPEETINFTFNFNTVIISVSQYLQYSSVFILFFAACYKFLEKIYYFKTLIWLHIVLSIILLIIIYWFSHQVNNNLALVEISNEGTIKHFESYNRTIHLLILAFTIIQTLPVINLLIGLLKQRKIVV